MSPSGGNCVATKTLSSAGMITLLSIPQVAISLPRFTAHVGFQITSRDAWKVQRRVLVEATFARSQHSSEAQGDVL